MPTRNSLTSDLIVLLGDSLTQHGWNVDRRGWAAQLSQEYIRRLDVVNRGYSGFNSRWGRIVLPKVLPHYATKKAATLGSAAEHHKPKLQLFAIFYGANDAQFPGYPAHVPLGEFKENLRGIVETVRSPESELHSPDARFLLITPPAFGDKLFVTYDNPGFGQRTIVDRSNAVAETYAQAVKEVASELAVPCVDLWTAMETKIAEGRASGVKSGVDGYDAYLFDGLHLNANGNDLLFGLVMDAIKTNYPDLDPNALPFVIPAFRTFSSAEELTEMLGP
ncbi:isoamyl acetate-hydrolyzing esterase [Coemansia biformis]|uniref:Isoamyl acetate-hydrolyzing esterase n=1 Tax=Coemansia biformis TaxID=1286918 RepID=A0A9W7Y288_9FUNG|nr:isoamyl acetate-hydrolyzing esterase [Coemansia biformis]